jgi:hypothetical protein
MVAPGANLGPFSVGANHVPKGAIPPRNNLNRVLPGSNHVSQGTNVFEALCDHNFCI